MYLAELHGFRLVHVAGGPEHHEERLAVALDLGPLVGFDGVLDGERVQPELTSDRVELFLARLLEADPGHSASFAAGLVGLLQGMGFRGPVAVDVKSAVYDHGAIIQETSFVLVFLLCWRDARSAKRARGRVSALGGLAGSDPRIARGSTTC